MRVLAFIGVLAIIAVIFAVVVFFGGFYNVAASNENPAIVDWALVHVRQASIAKHADVTPPISLDDAALVQAGARAFQQRGCTSCHGGPGVDWAKFSEGINPGPPDLAKDVVPYLRPAELFWVVKNGIAMTGMPSFGAIGDGDQEIWSIVAFLRKLPIVSEADYKTWTSAPAAPPAGGNP
jgi:hypothetical protein